VLEHATLAVAPQGAASFAAPPNRPRFAVDGIAGELAVCRIDEFCNDLHPDEERYVSHSASLTRLREFAAGRRCARTALQALGHGGGPVRVASDRSPIWPEGFIGSISHSGNLAAALVATRSSGVRSVGLDIEPATQLPEELIEDICGKQERDWLARRPKPQRLLLAKAIFSAKEAFYKCQYPLSRQFLEFQDVHVALKERGDGFIASFQIDAGPFSAGESLAGRLWTTSGHYFAVVSLA